MTLMTGYLGRAVGRNKKNAEAQFRDNRAAETRGKKLKLTYVYSDPPFKVYDVEVEGSKRRKR